MFSRIHPSADERVAALEAIVGHVFADKALALQSITHPSAVELKPEMSYQRLEFLGDSIVGFTVGYEAYKRYPHMAEGDLTRMRIAVVSGSFLSNTAADLGLGALIIFGSSEQASGARGMSSALEDVFEAITAALFLDAGLDKAQEWVLDCLGTYINPSTAKILSNPKSELQEVVQATGKVVSYRIVDTSGPSHQPTFTAEVLINGVASGCATGLSKKEAEASAAQCALDVLNGQE